MITVGNRQSFLDLAMQHAGDTEAALAMCIQNDVPITEEYPAGTLLPMPEIVNEEIVTLYKNEFVKPASILEAADTGNNLEGIDYWIIEDDFIVQ